MADGERTIRVPDTRRAPRAEGEPGGDLSLIVTEMNRLCLRAQGATGEAREALYDRVAAWAALGHTVDLLRRRVAVLRERIRRDQEGR